MKSKKLITSTFFACCLILAVACGAKSESSGETTETTAEELVYACPMHPEVTGKADDTCNKCGMALEKVEKTDSAAHHSH